MTAAHSGATMATDGIDLVDKDQTRSIFLSLFKQIANATGTDAHEHFNEVGAGNREKRNIRFTGDRASKQSFTRSRMADQQYTLRNAAAELSEFFRIAQKLDDFAKLLFSFFNPCDVLKRHAIFIFRKQARAAL